MHGHFEKRRMPRHCFFSFKLLNKVVSKQEEGNYKNLFYVRVSTGDLGFIDWGVEKGKGVNKYLLNKLSWSRRSAFTSSLYHNMKHEFAGYTILDNIGCTTWKSFF